jgi:transcriptional regulator with XRE-family HTH domain
MNNLKNERKKRGWTQKYVSDRLNITKTQISDLENGKSFPSYKLLLKIEDLYGMCHRELFSKISN